jgi:outer membrane phospholipase A
MMQWFSGCGENLIDDDHANRRIGLGIGYAD